MIKSKHDSSVICRNDVITQDTCSSSMHIEAVVRFKCTRTQIHDCDLLGIVSTSLLSCKQRLLVPLAIANRVTEPMIV